MEELIRQIRLAADAGLYYLALWGALTLPDLCGALASQNGQASGTKYKNWLRKWVPAQASDAEEVYGLRCSLMHQGRAMARGKPPIAFTVPGTGQLHNLSTVVGEDQVGWISLEIFVAEVTEGAERWLAEFGSTKRVQRNLEKFARLRPEGLFPHVAGPVIA